MARGDRHFVAAAAVAAAVAYTALFGHIHGLPQFQSDGYSYYVYLPSTLIYHDVTLEALADDWYGGRYPDPTGIRRWPSTGRWLNLHPIGTAILMTPFVLVADRLTVWSNLPRDGFSLYYQHGAAVGAMVYMLLGLAILQRMLRRHFSEGVVLATLICITWGTNLFHYAVFDGTFSHAYAFFLVCVWMWLVERWWDRPTLTCTLAVGGVAALNVLVRHTNGIYVLLLPLYGVVHWRDLRVRAVELRDRWRSLAIASAAGAIVLAPQLALYKWATGSWFVNAYVPHGMGFNFGSPHLADVLFSTQKGVFFWSPLLLLCAAGVCVATGWARKLALPATVLFALQTWLIASWTVWQFGASFGHRGYTDGFALGAPMMAACFAWVVKRPRIVPLFAVGTTAAVLLSIAQMIQYWIGVLPMENTTWAQYQDLFLRFR
jgi:hypothetical protein